MDFSFHLAHERLYFVGGGGEYSHCGGDKGRGLQRPNSPAHRTNRHRLGVAANKLIAITQKAVNRRRLVNERDSTATGNAL